MIDITLCRALIRYKGKYLFIRRTEDFIKDNIGKWECSGGKIDPGEDKARAIVREVKEETGLDCKILKELPFMSLKTQEIDSKCYIFLMEAPSEKVKLSKAHSEFRWLKANEAKNMEFVLFASLLLEYFNNEDYYLK